jgi:hypothetical protein
MIVVIAANLMPNLGLLPVEIRDPKTLNVVDRTVVRSLQHKLSELEQGQWLIAATLPSGKRLTETLNIGPGGKIEAVGPGGKIEAADLEAKLAEEMAQLLATSAPNIAHIRSKVYDGRLRAVGGALQNINWTGLAGNVGSYLAAKTIAPFLSDTSQGAAPLPSYVPDHSFRHPDAQLRFFRGSVLSGDVAEIGAKDITIVDVDGAKHVSPPPDQFVIIQLLRPDESTANLLLPPGATLKLSRQTRAGLTSVRVAVSFGDPLADGAVQLRSRTNLSELVTIGESLTLDEIRDLGTKPISAAICLLYLLLRTRESDIVKLALDGLPDAAAKSPDAEAMRGELAARAGDHKTALHALLRAAELGLPYFGQGVTNLADRLNIYAKMLSAPRRSDSDTAWWTDNDRTAVSAALNRLEPFSAACDYSAPVTTYSGEEPIKPSFARLSRAEFLGTTGFPISLS